MRFLVVGLNHKTAPVEVRERLSVSGERRLEALRELVSRPTVDEAAVLSTCNRTEIYVLGPEVAAAEHEVVAFLQAQIALPDCRLEPYLYRKVGLEAVQHLFRVVSGLDSMILGEAQILGQVKEALHAALNANSLGVHLGKVFRQAVEVGKRVRTETEIGQNAVSVSYAAVELARHIFGELTGKSVLIIGAGETGELTARTLAAHGATAILVANRTYERAVELAARFGGEAFSFDALPECLARTDIVISSTGAPHVVLDLEMVRQVMRRRRQRPLFLIDIAVPRDIDPRVNDLDNVYLYDIDDLQTVVERNLARREQEIERVERIIAEETAALSQWWSARQMVPMIKALKAYGDEIRERELERLFNRLPHLSPRDREMIRASTRAIVNRLLHQPVVGLKEASEEEARGAVYVEVLRKLFGLKLEEGSHHGSSPAEGVRRC
ncbi:MAG: glutamyl-tRNA reductase [Bacillota bacterium]|nr:glutamyl-tRNA reductase [Bacillota bacterium]